MRTRASSQPQREGEGHARASCLLACSARSQASARVPAARPAAHDSVTDNPHGPAEPPGRLARRRNVNAPPAHRSPPAAGGIGCLGQIPVRILGRETATPAAPPPPSGTRSGRAHEAVESGVGCVGGRRARAKRDGL
eukprot:gene10852-biopygen6318